MKFAAIVKKGIAFLICAALLTSDVMVTNATSVDTTEVSTELVREVNAASESVENTESVGESEKNKSTDTKETADSIKPAESIDSTETTESTESIESAENTETIESTEAVEHTETTEMIESTESTEATETIEEQKLRKLKTILSSAGEADSSKYRIVNCGEDTVTVTIEHYDARKCSEEDEQSGKIYSDDVCVLAPGAKISDYNKAVNWDVDYVQVDDETISGEALAAIPIEEDSTVKVFYNAKTAEYIADAAFYDYDVIPYDTNGEARADLSINADDNYPSEKTEDRFTVGTVSQNLEENRYDTITKKKNKDGTESDQHINVYTAGSGENAKKTGIITGLSEDYKEVLFSVNEPGVFPKDGETAANTVGLTVKKGYQLKFSQSGDTYELKEVLDDKNNVAATAGADFLPFGGNNFYFGMRYDVTFTLGDYIGDLNYSFTGDDDLWVILDGKQVVIDLGGIHDALTDTVDLWNYIDKEQGDKNQEHHLTVLYMERGAAKANCNMKFTLPNASVVKVVEDDVPVIPPEKPVEFTDKDVEYHKTAKLTDWEKREYQITLDASSLVTSQTTVEQTQKVDVMLVFDLSGSMNEILSGSNKLTDLGTFAQVKNSLDTNKVYYWNKYEQSGWGPWKTNESVGMGTTSVSGNKYAKYPVKYIDGAWKKYVSGSYQNLSDSDVIATWNAKITALKDAASGFVTGVAETSPESLIGIATFYGTGNGWYSSTEGKLNHGLAKVNENEMLKAVNALFADGGTSPQKGLEIAYQELKKAVDDNKKYVILFSDGEPSSNSDQYQTELSAQKLKTAGCTVITVGLGLNGDTATWLETKVASTGCAFTAETAEELNKIFQKIQSTITQSKSLTGVQVTDVIDSRFELTEAEIERLKADGATVTVNEDQTTTISWIGQEVKPKENGTAGWCKTIQIVAKESYLGGNNVTTNVNPGSYLSIGGTQLELPQPTVNVRIQYQISDAEDTIFLGESLEQYAEDAKGRMCDSNDIDASKLNMIFYTDKNCQKEISMENLKKEKPEEDITYYAKAFLPVEEATDASNANCTINGVVYKNNTEVEAATVEGENYAGRYEVKVKTGVLTLTKKISKKDIKASEGDPVFTFKITNQTTGDIYYKTLRFGEKGTEEQTTTNGLFNVKAQTTLEGLAQGIYQVEELDTMGFTLKEFEADTNCASRINGNSVKFAMGICSREEACSFDAKNFVTTAADQHLKADSAKITARNNKTRNDGKLTDTDAVKNKFVIGNKAESTTWVDNQFTADVRK